MRRTVIGVIGHVDHGKTALVKALTGRDTDSLPEERQRGISIALGFAHLQADADHQIDLVDMPGHERFVRTMIAGATGIDAVLLVVDALEGVRAQTIEHAQIATLLGLNTAVVAVTKADLVSPEQARETGAAACALLRGLGLECGQALATSARSGAGVDSLIGALAGLRPDPGKERNQARNQAQAYLPIDRAFSVPGHGPVVTGTLRGAALEVGAALALHPGDAPVRIRALQMHGQPVSRAEPGQRVAINLRGVDLRDLRRGMALGAPGALVPSAWLTVALTALESAPPLRNGMRLQVLLGTSQVGARLRLLAGDALDPGQASLAQVHCDEDVTVPVREPLILRCQGRTGTVAGGLVIESDTRRLRRHDGTILARLERLRGQTAEEIVEDALTGLEEGEASLPALARLSGMAPERIAEIASQRGFHLKKDGGIVSQAAIAAQRLRLSVRRDPAAQARDAEAARAMALAMQAAGLTPPTPKELVRDAISHRAAEHLLRSGALIRATDRAKGKELYFHADAIAHARQVLADRLACPPGLLVSEIAEALGISRKFAMPLLDHLDTIRFTRRLGDRRVLHE